jgi:hypothetical protein
VGEFSSIRGEDLAPRPYFYGLKQASERIGIIMGEVLGGRKIRAIDHHESAYGGFSIIGEQWACEDDLIQMGFQVFQVGRAYARSECGAGWLVLAKNSKVHGSP